MKRVFLAALFLCVSTLTNAQWTGVFNPMIVSASCVVTTQTIFNVVMNLNEGGDQGYTLASAVSNGGLTPFSPAPACPPSQIRLTMDANSGVAYSIDKMYVGAQGGSCGGAVNCQFSTTPTQVTVLGSNTWTVSAGGQTTSDWVNYAWDGSSGIVSAWYRGVVPASPRYVAGGVNYGTALKAGDEAAVVAKSGFADDGGRYVFVSKIEVR